MSLGGASETHATIALQPEALESAAEPQTLQLGDGYELCIVRCTGHYAHAAPSSADSVRSAKQPTVAKGRRANTSATAASPTSHSRASGSSQAMVLSDYPLLLVHAQVSVRRTGLAMAGDALLANTSADEPETLALSRGLVSESRKQAARREAQELGDFMEAMLLG